MRRGQNSGTYQVRKKAKTSKECELGQDCPYKNEMQHRMEFSHNLDSKTIRKEQSFASKGSKLGGSASGKSILTQQSSTPASRFTQIQPTTSSRVSGTVGSRLVQHTIDHFPSVFDNSPQSSNDIFCDVCFKFIRPSALATHAASHESSNRDILRDNQDLEYENSLIADLERDELKLAEEKKREQETRRLEEEAILCAALENSKRLAENEDFEYAVKNLLPEPNADYNGKIVRVKFTLPNGSKHVRSFRQEHCVQDMFNYLKSIIECRPYLTGHVLRDAVGSITVKVNTDNRTFTEANIVGSCSLLLAPSDESDEEKVGIPVPSVTTSESSSRISVISDDDINVVPVVYSKVKVERTVVDLT